MTLKATLWVQNMGLMTRMIGANHAGLELREDNIETYITWDGGGANQSRSGCGPSYRGHAHWRLGHQQKFSKEGEIVNNVDHQGRQRTEETRRGDGFRRHKVTDEPLWKDEYKNTYNAYACEIPVRDESARNFANTDVLWGLSIRPIKRWWYGLLALPPSHPKRIYSKLGTMEDFDKGKGTNCCGMVALALGVGRLDVFATPPSNTVYQGSRTLIEWVEKAVKKINTLNSQRNLIRSTPEYTTTTAWDTLPTFKVWEAASKVMIGWRKDQIAKIDTILKAGVPPVPQRRSSFRSVLDGAQNPVLEKYAELYGHCFEHLAMKPTSDRRKAVLKLAKTLEMLSTAMIDNDSDSDSDSRLGSFRE
jgi:hypothetical protein